MEIIAQRAKGLVVSNIIVLIAAAFLVGMAIWMIGYVGSLGWIVGLFALAMVIVVVVVAVRALVRIRKVPEVIATREGDTLVFLGERVRFSEIASVDYRNARGRYGSMEHWGKITVFTESGKALSCDFVADVNRVHDRIMQLKYEYSAKGSKESFL